MKVITDFASIIFVYYCAHLFTKQSPLILLEMLVISRLYKVVIAVTD